MCCENNVKSFFSFITLCLVPLISYTIGQENALIVIVLDILRFHVSKMLFHDKIIVFKAIDLKKRAS